MQVERFQLVRRAWGDREIVGHFTGTWGEAMDFATHLTRTQRDGEYFEKREHEPLYPASNPPQDWCD